MEENNKIETFELDVVSNAETGELFVIKDTYKQVGEILAQFLPFEITNDAEKKTLKQWRASFNKVAKAIDRRRIDTINDYTTSFTNECNELKALFLKRVEEFDTEIKKYENSQKEAVVEQTSVRKYVATIKFTDEKIVKKLTEFCTKNACELTIK